MKTFLALVLMTTIAHAEDGCYVTHGERMCATHSPTRDIYSDGVEVSMTHRTRHVTYGSGFTFSAHVVSDR